MPKQETKTSPVRQIIIRALKKGPIASPERSDAIERKAKADYESVISVVTFGEDKGIAEAAADLIRKKQKEIVALARKDTDIKKAMFGVMEDVVQVVKTFDEIALGSARASGYTGIAFEGIYAELKKKRGEILEAAISDEQKPTESRSLETIVSDRIDAEIKNSTDLYTTMEIEPDLNDILLEAVKRDIEALDELVKKGNGGKSRDKEYLSAINTLDREIQSGCVKALEYYLRTYPDATEKNLTRYVVKNELDEYVTETMIKRILKGINARRILENTDWKTKHEDVINARRKKEAAARLDGLDDPDKAPNVKDPAAALADWTDFNDTTKPQEKTQVRLTPAAAQADSVSYDDVTERIQRTKPKKAFFDRVAAVAQKAKRGVRVGMMLLLGIGGGRHDLPERSVPELTPRTPLAGLEIPASEVQTSDSIVSMEQTPIPEPEKTRTAVKTSSSPKSMNYPRGDARNLRGALEILNSAGLPSKAEYLKMKEQERKRAVRDTTNDLLSLNAKLRKVPSNDRTRRQLENQIRNRRAFLDMARTVKDL
jgi:hypothetical protein